jgi:hypothetical protein
MRCVHNSVVSLEILVKYLQGSWEAKRPLRCPGGPPKLTIKCDGMR